MVHASSALAVGGGTKVPEPSMLGLLAIGVAAIGARAYFKRRK